MGTGTKPDQPGLPKDFFVKLAGFESRVVISTTWRMPVEREIKGTEPDYIV